MKHERRITHCVCSDCDGRGVIEVGRRGPNDPDIYEVECEECYGTGEVTVQPLDPDDDHECVPASEGAAS